MKIKCMHAESRAVASTPASTSAAIDADEVNSMHADQGALSWKSVSLLEPCSNLDIAESGMTVACLPSNVTHCLITANALFEPASNLK